MSEDFKGALPAIDESDELFHGGAYMSVEIFDVDDGVALQKVWTNQGVPLQKSIVFCITSFMVSRFFNVLSHSSEWSQPSYTVNGI